MRLLVEEMLGRLGRRLRLMGLDAPSVQGAPPRPPLGDVLLTRRREMAGRPGVFLVESDLVDEQLTQVLGGLGIAPAPENWFSRCLDCNLAVQPLAREQARGLVPDYVLATAERFTRCPGCGKVFWPGSHGGRARRRLEQIMADAQPALKES